MDADLHAQIADFGLTRISEVKNTGTNARHLNFAAPELFGYCEDDISEDDDVPIKTQKSDVYAFGCLYYEVRKIKGADAFAEQWTTQVYYDAIPFAGKTDVQIMRLHSRGAHPPRLDLPPLSDHAWELIQSCWAREASKRPGMDVIRAWMDVVSQSSTPALAPPDPSCEIARESGAPSPMTPMCSSLSPLPDEDALSFEFANGTRVVLGDPATSWNCEFFCFTVVRMLIILALYLWLSYHRTYQLQHNMGWTRHPQVKR